MAGKGKPVDLAKELGKVAEAVADSLFGEDEVAEDDESVRSLRTAMRGGSVAAVLTIPFCEVVWTPRDEMTEAMAKAFNAMLDTIPVGPDADEMSEEAARHREEDGLRRRKADPELDPAHDPRRDWRRLLQRNAG